MKSEGAIRFPTRGNVGHVSRRPELADTCRPCSGHPASIAAMERRDASDARLSRSSGNLLNADGTRLAILRDRLDLGAQPRIRSDRSHARADRTSRGSSETLHQRDCRKVGFLNYTFAMGVAYLVFAAWIATDGKRSLLHIVGFAFAITAIYFCHLFALATLLLMIGCYELSILWRGSTTASEIVRRAAALAAIILPAAIAFIALKPAGEGGKLAFNFADSALDRYEAAIQYHFDVPAFFLTGTLIVLFIAGVAMRILRVDSRMFGVLIALLLGALFMPEWALGGWGVDLRLPPVLGAIAFAATDLRLPSRTAIAAGAVALIGLGFSALVLAGNWQYYDARYREFRANATAIHSDARVLTVLDGDSLGWSSDQPYWHMGEYAVIDRAAATQLLFATRGQHVVRVNPPLEEYVAETAQEGSPPDISELTDLAQNRVNGDIDIETVFPYLMRFQCHFDQVLMVHGGGTRSPVPPMLKPRHEGSFYTIYDIVHDQRCTI